jgi:hypothetical protein
MVFIGFLCLRYSAIGRGAIASENANKFTYVTVLDTNMDSRILLLVPSFAGTGKQQILPLHFVLHQDDRGCSYRMIG